MIFSRLAVLLVGAVASVKADAADTKVAKRAIRPNPSNGHWVDAWASMPQLTEPANLPPAPFVRATTQSLKSSLLFDRTNLVLFSSTPPSVKHCL